MLVLTLRRRRREAKRADLVTPPAQQPELSPEIRNGVIKLRAEGRTISAIKLASECVDVDLKTAKDIVERLR
jgi:ribosomal protein L7/L12